MGKLLPQYQKSVVEDIINSISSGDSNYYAFAANPISYAGDTPDVTEDDYTTTFTNNWQMLFGKKLSAGNISPVIKNNLWQSGTVYNRYDHTSVNLNNYYVICRSTEYGSYYNIYKCIDNNGGGKSTSQPDQVQETTFIKEDGYKWRYISSIPYSVYNKIATDNYSPVTSNNDIVTNAYVNSGVEVVVINQAGDGYSSYSSGVIQGKPSTTRLQIQSSTVDQDFFTGNSIYIYNDTINNAQLADIARHIITNGAHYVTLDTPVNIGDTYVKEGVTKYKISPKVVFDTDGELQPKAITTVNPSGNSIQTIQIIDPGSGISWANVSIQSNNSYGSGAAVYGIVPPAGGHGSNPAVEMGVVGFSTVFEFSNTENNTISGGTRYNKIGLIKNPYSISQETGEKTTRYTSATFSSLLEATVSTPVVFDIGEKVVGYNSKAIGTVAFSNSSQVFLTGDRKRFIDGERIDNETGKYTSITINTIGDIYTKDLTPLYIQNITDVARSTDIEQSELFKLIIKV